jgi:hypothetical protein
MALREVLAREIDGLGPEPRGDRAVEDVLGERDDLPLVVALEQRHRALPDRREVGAVLTDLHEAEVVPGEERDIPDAEHPLAERALADMEGARTTHERVVHIEERDDRTIARRPIF